MTLRRPFDEDPQVRLTVLLSQHWTRRRREDLYKRERLAEEKSSNDFKQVGFSQVLISFDREGKKSILFLLSKLEKRQINQQLFLSFSKVRVILA